MCDVHVMVEYVHGVFSFMCASVRTKDGVGCFLLSFSISYTVVVLV